MGSVLGFVRSSNDTGGMVGGVKIHLARPEHGERIGVLTEGVYRECGFVADDAYSADLLDGPGRVRDAHVLVALLDGRLVGTVTLAEAGNRLAHVAVPGELEVRMLAVAADARGQGVADSLMAAAENHTRGLGHRAVVLSTEPEMGAAQRLYARRGFHRVPHRDWTIGNVILLAYHLPLTTTRG
jgi:ribosomal protein S18 acetylase RimI-like enzyme